jgi:hypothetical protein
MDLFPWVYVALDTINCREYMGSVFAVIGYTIVKWVEFDTESAELQLEWKKYREGGTSIEAQADGSNVEGVELGEQGTSRGVQGGPPLVLDLKQHNSRGVQMV